MIKKWMATIAAFALLLPAIALAQEEFEGTVVAGDTVTMVAPYGGSVTSVALREGELITAGDAVAAIQTTQVLAPVDGTVRGIFVQPGDSLDQTTALYLAPVSKYTVECSISKAYSSIDTTYVRIGESVYIKCTKDGSHKAVGTIVAVDGSKYTVQTTGGELYMEETVYIYRSDEYTLESRIGSGTVSRTEELAITASGSLLAIHVKDGDTVERGQLLFETVEGTVDVQGTYDGTIRADVQGVVAEVKVSAGQKIAKGDVLLTVYNPESYQIKFSIDEDLLGEVKVGDRMGITFHWNEDSGDTIQGTVTGISYVSESSDAAASGQTDTTSSSSSAQYTGYATFTAADSVRLGMSVTLSTVEQ